MNEWIGYSPMDVQAMNVMKQLWRTHALPDEPDFTDWSKEFGREVYEVVSWMTNPETVASLEVEGEDARVELLRMLESMEVWDEDPACQQWAPRGSR